MNYAQTEDPHARGRRIKKLDVRTPLIVPSFSIRGFPRLLDIYEEMRFKLNGVCLVSASDIANSYIPADVMDTTNVVFIDSGRYESCEQEYGAIGYYAPPSNDSWTRSRYHDTIGSVSNGANTIIVNFDCPASLDEQIRGATEDFTLINHAASDFLVKPESTSTLVNVPKLQKHTRGLGSFDIIGVAAREVAHSFVKRCSAIVTLRNILNDAGLDTPIHIFGAIRPCEVLAYFFCGADIFDGLNWLRFAFKKHGSIAIEEAAAEEMKWNKADDDLLFSEWASNLRFLYRLQEAMRRYGDTGDLTSLAEEFPAASRSARIAHISGAEIHKGAKEQ